MALAGVHIAFATVAPSGAGGYLTTGAALSQTMAAGGTSTIAAPVAQLCSLSASAPIFYAVGATPDASAASSARHYYDPATGREDLYVQPGDRIAWVFA